jgi:hypothetical protein
MIKDDYLRRNRSDILQITSKLKQIVQRKLI